MSVHIHLNPLDHKARLCSCWLTSCGRSDGYVPLPLFSSPHLHTQLDLLRDTIKHVIACYCAVVGEDRGAAEGRCVSVVYVHKQGKHTHTLCFILTNYQISAPTHCQCFFSLLFSLLALTIQAQFNLMLSTIDLHPAEEIVLFANLVMHAQTFGSLLHTHH